ncbi:MAG: hypothetical protein ACI828_001097 [Flavobacteriales bacterium]|jgi:hypothetical protein
MNETPVKSGGRKAMHYRGAECLNCGHPLDLTDRFCAYCGQINTTKRLTIIDFFNEFVLSVFTYDSRFRHTLKDLLFKPGTITRYYVNGKRFHYANPFRFFLSASIFYFIIIGIMTFFNDNNLTITSDNEISNIGIVTTDSIPEPKKVELPPLFGERIEEKLNEDIKKAVKERNEETQKARARKDSGITEQYYSYIAEKDIDSVGGIEAFVDKIKFFNDFYKTTKISSPAKALDSLKYEHSKTNIWLYEKNEVYERIEKHPIRFAQYLASKTPFFLFFFAPFFALFLWLIYSKKKFNYMEHLVFIFHIFSWVFIVLLICLPIDTLLNDNNLLAGILLGLIGPFYFYKALRNFYKQNRFFTIIKFVFLNVVFMFATSIFAIIFFALTAAFY